MKKMRNIFSLKSVILAIACILSLVVFAVLLLISAWLMGKQESQQAASRWSAENDAAQISCFFSVNAAVTADTLEAFSHSVDSALEEASIVSESPNGNARLWADAYSADGKITLKSERGTLQADAIGIGGDFFRFHPVKLLYGSYISVDAIGIGGDFFLFHPVRLLNGSYFSGNDVMQDYCIIDELTAWKLFGSNDVAGQIIEIKGVSHVITGVVRHEDGKLYKAAGLDEAMVYVSYDTLNKYGSCNGINHYEIVMPNPVSGYALNYVTEHIGVSENDVEIVENNKRYSALNRVKQIGEFSTRSMNGKAIIYPYWENVARAYEDILATLMLFILLFGGVPAIIIAVTIILLWKRKTWTVKGVLLKGKDAAEMKLSRMRTAAKEKRKSKKKHNQEWVDIKEYEEE